MTRSAKGFISSGNQSMIKSKDNLYLLLGAIGGCLTFLGLFLPPKLNSICFVICSTFLLITAINFKLVYFIALETILISGHAAILFGIGLNLQIALPILLSLQLLIFYGLSGQLTNLYILIGITGIALHSIGLVHQNDIIFLGGSATIAIYAIHAAQQTKQAWLWAILNGCFALFSLTNLLIHA